MWEQVSFFKSFNSCFKKAGISKQVQQVGHTHEVTKKWHGPIWNIRQTVCRRHHMMSFPPQMVCFVFLQCIIHSTSTVHKRKNPSPGPAWSALPRCLHHTRPENSQHDFCFDELFCGAWVGLFFEGPENLILKTFGWVKGAETARCVALGKEGGANN